MSEKMIKCKACSNEMSNDAKMCPKCGKPNKKMGCMTKGVIAVVGLMVFGAIINGAKSGSSRAANDSPAQASAGSPARGANVANLAIPQDQQAFINIIIPSVKQYTDAPNELKKSAVRANRKEAIQKALTSFEVKNWVGKIKRLATNSDGKAYIEITLEGTRAITIKTWNNALSDMSFDTLIDLKSSLFQKLSNMEKGTLVVFSGTFFTGENDYIKESSMTERGSMEEPAFIMAFSDVSPYSGK